MGVPHITGSMQTHPPLPKINVVWDAEAYNIRWPVCKQILLVFVYIHDFEVYFRKPPSPRFQGAKKNKMNDKNKQEEE